MVPPLSLALCHEALEGGGNHKIETSGIAKRNFPSCSLRSQFTASQKLPLLFLNALVVPYCNFLVSIWTGFDLARKLAYQIHLSLLWQNGFCLHMKHFGSLSLAKCFYVPKAYTKKKLPLFLALLEIHCLTKKLRAFLFPNALVVPYCHSLAERLLFAHETLWLAFARKVFLCAKSLRKNGNFPSLEIHCLTKKLRAFLFPNALVVPYCHSLAERLLFAHETLWLAFARKVFLCAKSLRKKETSPLSRFARNSLPHKKASRFFVPQCSSGPILPFFGFQKLYMIYGKKPTNTPENFDSLASLTFTLCYATLFKIFYPPRRVRADGESHPPARLVIASLRSL